MTPNVKLCIARAFRLREQYVEMGITEHLAERTAALDVEEELEGRGEIRSGANGWTNTDYPPSFRPDIDPQDLVSDAEYWQEMKERDEETDPNPLAESEVE